MRKSEQAQQEEKKFVISNDGEVAEQLFDSADEALEYIKVNGYDTEYLDEIEILEVVKSSKLKLTLAD